MTSPLHTKLKELRELRERATPGVWDNRCNNNLDNHAKPRHIWDSTWGFIGEMNSGSQDIVNSEFIAQAANNWLTLIEALEKAVERLEDIGITKIAFGPERVSSCSADEANEALAEIGEMLGKD